MIRAQIVSAIYGKYDAPKKLPDPYTNGSHGSIMFTDNFETAELAEDAGWHVIIDELDFIVTPMLRAKFWKTHLAQAVPEADVAIWVDGSMLITEPTDFIQLCLQALGTDDVSFTPHPERNCIYPEAELTASLARYGDCDPRAQVNFYRDVMNWPRNNGLMASGAFTMRLNDTTDLWGEHWWSECMNWTYQDQLSLPVITDLMGKQGMKWNLNMPWHKWWSLLPHGS